MKEPDRHAGIPSTMGRYAIVGPLASGGMAEILLGKLLGPNGFERAVVIKRILPHLARQPSIVNMFLDEAKIVSQIRHPNVVQVHELGQEGGELFQVFEYLDGESAVGLMRRISARGERLDVDLAAFIVAEALAGLSAAHTLTDAAGVALHIVHRDVSPENVFITYDGSVKLLDFGVARMENRLTRTKTGETKGKFAYMSPEQVRGETLDARSDLFSIGTMLHDLTTGKRLFHRDSAAATVHAVCELPLPHPSRTDKAYPVELEAICLRALARDKQQRYQTAMEMRRDLLGYLRKRDGAAAPTEVLAEHMHRLFPDRIAEKRLMLSRLASSDLPVDIPVEADSDVELPIATIPSGPPLHVQETDVARRLVRGGALVVGALLLTVVASVSWLRFGARAPVSTLRVTSLSATPGEAQPQQAPAPAPKIRIEILSRPAGAAVLIDGRPRGKTPLLLEEERQDRQTWCELSKDGFVTVQRTLALGVDQVVDIALVPVREPKRSPPRPPPPAKKPKHPEFERL